MPGATPPRHPLSGYVTAVAVVWAVVLLLSWVVGGRPRQQFMEVLCAGFFLGMLAMYIAVHIYEWK